MLRQVSFVWFNVSMMIATFFGLSLGMNASAEARPKILRVTLEIKVKHGTTIRMRRSSFDTFMNPRKKIITVKNGAAWLHLTINTTPPNQFKLTGALKLKEQFSPIEIPLRKLQVDKTWVTVIKIKLDKKSKLGKSTNATIRIKAGVYSSVKRQKGNNFKVVFKNVPLRRILRKLAELNGYKLAVAAGVPKKQRIKLTLQASSRAKLIAKVCKKFGLHCKVMAKVLWVKKATKK